ncbi:MAG: hypothetical protein HRT89_12145 [Lentisphaeria bacterium]|nr:hypothetical protein [Lentisphaeria bacterium]NQZ68809.1 hypothetical protein [Lentisphaeria bacterium]
MSIGFPGQLGALDIINEYGIALSFNQLGRGNKAPVEPVWIAIRRIAETKNSFKSAREEILNLPAGMPFLITLSSSNEKEFAVFERTKNSQVVEHLPKNNRMGANNSATDHAQNNSEFDKAIRQFPATIAGTKSTMRTKKVLALNNLYSVIWHFNANRFYLASGTIPAAKGNYRKYELFNE